LLQKSIHATLAAPSVSFAATSTSNISSALSGAPAIAGNLTLTSVGSVDRHTPGSPLLDLTLGGNFSTNTATDTGSAAFSLHTIYAQKHLYLELNNFILSYKSTDPKEAMVQLVVLLANGFAASIENKWIDLGTQQEDASLVHLATSSPALARDEAALVAYAQGGSYVTSAQNIGVENINGIPAYHLKLVLTFEQQLADLILNIQTDQNPASAGTASYLQLKNSLARQVGNKANVDVWVGKSDSLLYQLTLSPLTITDSTTNSTVVVSMQSTYSDYGNTFSIVAPQGAEPLQQIMGQLLGGLMASSTKK
jgi:hypothetical protein